MAVFVVGSLNRDVIIDVSLLPTRGQTLASTGLSWAHGGKGMNQAVACALAGGDVHLIGCVGADPDGEALQRFATARGVDISGVLRLATTTGTAHVFRSMQGDNFIVITAGANAEVSPTLVAEGLAGLGPGDLLVVQGEIPGRATVAAIDLAVEAGARVVLNLAPVIGIPPATLAAADPLVVNEVEAAELLRITTEQLLAAPEAALLELATRTKSVAITLGPAGAVIGQAGATTRIPAPQAANVVDTTGAGDAYVGVLAARLSQGRDLEAAARSATAAATLSVSRPGAADSYNAAFQEL